MQNLYINICLSYKAKKKTVTKLKGHLSDGQACSTGRAVIGAGGEFPHHFYMLKIPCAVLLPFDKVFFM